MQEHVLVRIQAAFSLRLTVIQLDIWHLPKNGQVLLLRNLLNFLKFLSVSQYNLQPHTFTGAGTMVAAVSCSVQKEPIVVGKPSSFLMDFLLKRFAKCNMRNIPFICHQKSIVLFFERGKREIYWNYSQALNKLAIDWMRVFHDK